MTPLTRSEIIHALRWLQDIPFAPGFDSPAGAGWLERLGVVMASMRPTAEELEAACRAIASQPKATFPTPGQIGTAIREYRTARGEAHGGPPPPAPPTAPRIEAGDELRYPPADWLRAFRAQPGATDRMHNLVTDLVRRGHAGLERGEGYVRAVWREEQEARAAQAAGQPWTPPRYGPSLLGGQKLRVRDGLRGI